MIPAENKEFSMLQRHLGQMYLELRKFDAQVCVGTMLWKPHNGLVVKVPLPDAQENWQFLWLPQWIKNIWALESHFKNFKS